MATVLKSRKSMLRLAQHCIPSRLMNALIPTRAQATLLVLVGAILISFAPIFARVADVAPTASAFYRMAFGAIGFAVLLLSQASLRQGFARHWASSALIAGLFTADLWMWHQSILLIGPGLSTLLANFQVFILTAVGVIWLGERVNWRFGTGLGLSALGLWLLFGRDWVQLSPEARLGVILGLLTAVAYGLYLLGLRTAQIRSPSLRPETRLAQVTICCGLMLGTSNLLEGHSFIIPDLNSLAALVALGLFCQVLGWLLITRGLPFLPAALVGLLLLLQPTASVGWDVLWFGLQLKPAQWLGAAVALTGIYLGLRASVRSKAPAASAD